MKFSAASLRALLEAEVPAEATGLVVALSGGFDSACLATALSQIADPSYATAGPSPTDVPPPIASLADVPPSPIALPTDVSRSSTASPTGSESPPMGGFTWRGLPVRAVHVDHGLQATAAEFRIACGDLCRRLGMPLDIIDVVVATDGGVSLEAAARTARYQGFAQVLKVGECLLTAHHATDQAETLLLQLLRGAGLKGLSAMPIRRVLGAGWQLRPLLATPKRELLRFGVAAGVSAVPDPMNQDRRFDRAYLRAAVWPLIEGRWPGATSALARAARHMADAQQLLDEAAALALRQLADGDGLSVTGLRLLPERQQLNALRYWLAEAGLTSPSTARLTEALRQIMQADDDHLPAVVWDGQALRRYRDRVLVTPAVPCRLGEPREWAVGVGSTLELESGLGRLRWIVQVGALDAARLPPSVMVRRRRGGESLKPRSFGKTHSVQHLCQSHGVLPWMRDALPFIYAGDALLAVGDLWQDARRCVAQDALGLAVAWEGAPSVV